MKPSVKTDPTNKYKIILMVPGEGSEGCKSLTSSLE